MIQYNTLNVKLPNSELNRLKQRIKIDSQVTINFSPHVVDGSNEETDYHINYC